MVAGPGLEARAEEGQRVAKGTLLARIDDTAIRDQLLSARSGVRLDVDATKAGVGEEIPILHLLQRAGDASDPQFHVAAHLLGHLAADDDGVDAEGLDRTQARFN